MIISDAYPNDGNAVLKAAQHAQYFPNVARMFDAARKELVCADAILMAETLLARKVQEVRGIDHRVLQDAHDIIAATYRYRHDDGTQGELFEPGCDLTERYTLDWNRWFASQIEQLSMIPAYVQSVVECVIFANTVLGYAAERRLGELLVCHYGLDDWADLDGYPKTYSNLKAPQ